MGGNSNDANVWYLDSPPGAFAKGIDVGHIQLGLAVTVGNQTLGRDPQALTDRGHRQHPGLPGNLYIRLHYSPLASPAVASVAHGTGDHNSAQKRQGQPAACEFFHRSQTFIDPHRRPGAL